MKKLLLAFAISLVSLSTPTSNVLAADKAAGKIAFETCRGCHSTPQYSSVYPTYYVPKIGGQRAFYTEVALKAYRNGTRAHGSSMPGNAANLSDATIDNIALYTEKARDVRKTAPASGNPKKGKELAAACESCHTKNLKDEGQTAPILAGQYGNYLEKAIKDYQTDVRQDPTMQAMVNGLTEDEIRDIAAYFAKQRGLSIVK